NRLQQLRLQLRAVFLQIQQRLAERMTFRLSWLSGDFPDFAAWRATARSRVREQLLAAPPSAWRPIC
ncbi:MAG: hypothetical protein WCT12_26815, partial [Verrucomicrobiota bacterium]